MSDHDKTTPDDDTIYTDGDGNYVDAAGNPVDVEEVPAARFRLRGNPEEAERKRAEKDAERDRRNKEKNLRSRGNARRLRLLVGCFIAAMAFSLLSLMQSCGVPSKSEVTTMVDDRLADTGKDFPVGQAVMWSGQVMTTWANWDEGKAKQRQTLISPFLSQGMDPQAGWNGTGTQKVLYTSINPDPVVLNTNRAIVTGAYMVQDGSWRCASLKVYATKPTSFSSTAMFAFALAGNPTPVACSPTTGAPPLQKESTRTDKEAQTELQNKFFPGFFAAWASSDQATLGQYLDDGVKTVGLGGAYRSDPAPVIESVSVPVEGEAKTVGDTTTATVTVIWTALNSSANNTASYNVPLHRKGGQWFVSGEPAPSAQDPNVQGGTALNANDTGNSGEEGSDDNPTSGDGVYDTPSPSAQPTPSSIAPGGIESGQ